MAIDINIDAILAKREEATGSKDTFTFQFKDRTWTAKDPIVADDEWKDELGELSGDVDVAEHYLGFDQYDEFLEAGGRAGYVLLAVKEFMRNAVDETEQGPTRRSTSSAQRRKRSKRR